MCCKEDINHTHETQNHTHETQNHTQCVISISQWVALEIHLTHIKKSRNVLFLLKSPFSLENEPERATPRCTPQPMILADSSGGSLGPGTSAGPSTRHMRLVGAAASAIIPPTLRGGGSAVSAMGQECSVMESTAAKEGAMAPVHIATSAHSGELS
jgi:hypothetical protein